MKKQEMVAMVLAGGRGTRLESLTRKNAKPAVYFGGKYRIIDFPLSNCSNSNIDVVGVLTQYESILLNRYTANAKVWGFDKKDSGIYILPPREKDNKDLGVYRGTADAITQNIDFIDSHDPEYVLILSGDHIYKMNYDEMLDEHKKNNADCTIAVYEVPLAEASRFGIMNCNEDMSIYEFEEKPKTPKSTLASMGIYIFNWKTLKKYLLEDELLDSSHDFGKNIIPNYLSDGLKMYGYSFKGYWKDVGTIESLWEANMDLLKTDSELQLFDKNWKIYTENHDSLPQYISSDATITNSFINEGSNIYGTVKNSVIFQNVIIEKGAIVEDSVILPNTTIKKNAIITKSIVEDNLTIFENSTLGNFEFVTLVTKEDALKNKSINEYQNEIIDYSLVNSSETNTVDERLI